MSWRDWSYLGPVNFLNYMTRFLVYFCSILAVLFIIEMLQPVQNSVVDPFTQALAKVSIILILPFDDSVIAQGRTLRDIETGFAVSIQAGCNGIEAAIVLIAAVFAFPAKLAQKLIAIISGFFFLQTMNVARIISLFYLGQLSLEAFKLFHLYLWPVLIMLDVLIIFACYLEYLRRLRVMDLN